jgi:anti-anti-sigma factor
MQVPALSQRVPIVEVIVHGDLDAVSAHHVHDMLQEAIDLMPQQLIINLAECPSIDAAGILLLLDVHRKAMRNGGTVALRSPGERLKRNLRLARVDRVLQVIGPPVDVTGLSETAIR